MPLNIATHRPHSRLRLLMGVSSLMMDRPLMIFAASEMDRNHDIPYLAGYGRRSTSTATCRDRFAFADAPLRSLPDPARGGREGLDRSAQPALSAHTRSHIGLKKPPRRRHHMARLRPLHAEIRQNNRR
jgi:hypothetical protein